MPAADGAGWISADSHVVEPPHLFEERLPAAFRDRAPHVVRDPARGDVYVVPGLPHPVPLGFARPPDLPDGVASGAVAHLDDLRAGGADAGARLVDQDLDGLRAEVLYPTVGLVLLRQPDPGLRAACASAYNRWLSELCAQAPERLLGVAMVAPERPADALAAVTAGVDGGAVGLLATIRPEGPDYDDRRWDPLFDAAASSGRPLSFHALGGPNRRSRGPALAALATQSHEGQELLATLVLGGVLDRFPSLQVVLAELDASWLGHLAERMDRLTHVHGGWGGAVGDRLPSEAIAQQVHLAIPNDERALGVLPPSLADRLLWGSDYPHAETTWPRSAARLAAAVPDLSAARRAAFTSGNAARLYDLG